MCGTAVCGLLSWWVCVAPVFGPVGIKSWYREWLIICRLFGDDIERNLRWRGHVGGVKGVLCSVWMWFEY